LVGLGTLFTRRRPVLLLQLAGALVALIVSLRILLP
jgi:hypothetical protein